MKYKPMLAYPVSDKPIDYKSVVYMQPKLDGVRCLIQYENRPLKNVDDLSGQLTENVVVAYSRNGKEWKNIDHILKELKPFFIDNPHVVLDGELYNHKFKDDFESIISMVRKTKPTDEDRRISAQNVQFHCYDIIDTSKNYMQRKSFIAKNLPIRDSIVSVFTQLVSSEREAKQVHKTNLANGYEGSIVRINDVYKCGRSWSLRKFKDFHDAEANIVGYEEGKGKRAGTLGKFLMQDDDGNQFGCPPGKGHNYKDLALMLENIHQYMGQRATFTFFERTKAGSYRHPLFKCIRNYE
jgi:ATP-dependent DNA ligase